MATWRNIITDALHEISVVALGEEPDDDQIAKGLDRAEGMLEEWALDGLLIPVKKILNITTASGKTTYVIGVDGAEFADVESGANLPARVDSVVYKDVGSTRTWPLRRVNEPLLNRHYETSYNGSPNWYYSEYLTDRVNIRLDRPTLSGAGIDLYTDGFLSVATDADEESGLPGGYRRAVMYNLALELAALFGVIGGELPQATVYHARKAKSVLVKRNAQPIIAKLEPGALMSQARDGYARLWRP